jgi:hypothetical protein
LLLKQSEIEALLALDGSKLLTAHRVDKKTPEWIFVITTKKGDSFARNTTQGDKINEALNDVWGAYQRYMCSDKREDLYWLYEFAMADVELRVIKNLKLTKAPKWAEDITGEADVGSQDQ